MTKVSKMTQYYCVGSLGIVQSGTS